MAHPAQTVSGSVEINTLGPIRGFNNGQLGLASGEKAFVGGVYLMSGSYIKLATASLGESNWIPAGVLYDITDPTAGVSAATADGGNSKGLKLARGVFRLKNAPGHPTKTIGVTDVGKKTAFLQDGQEVARTGSNGGAGLDGPALYVAKRTADYVWCVIDPEDAT